MDGMVEWDREAHWYYVLIFNVAHLPVENGKRMDIEEGERERKL